MTLPPAPSVPDERTARAVHATLVNLLSMAGPLFRELFLDGASSRSARLYGQADLNELVESHGIAMSRSDYEGLELDSLERCGLITSTSERSRLQVVGLFQVFSLAFGKNSSCRPVFLITDFPGANVRHAVFPAYLFRTQLEHHLRNATALVRSGARILDAGCGSGAYTLYLAGISPRCSIIGIDTNARALDLGRAGARLNGFEERISFVEADLRTFMPEEPTNLIVSNPPYVALPPHLLGSFFSWADGGADGMTYVRALIDRADELLSSEGRLSIVSCLLGTAREDRANDLLAGAASDLRICLKQYVSPPMWSGFNPLWSDRNPLPVADFYRRIPSSAALEEWISGLTRLGLGFVHNRYLEFARGRARQDPIARRRTFSPVRKAIRAIGELAANVSDLVSLVPTNGFSPRSDGPGVDDLFQPGTIRKLLAGEHLNGSRFSAIGRLGRSLDWAVLPREGRSTGVLRLAPLGRGSGHGQLRIAGNLVLDWERNEGRNTGPSLDLLSGARGIAQEPRLIALSTGIRSPFWLTAPDLSNVLSRSDWSAILAEAVQIEHDVRSRMRVPIENAVRRTLGDTHAARTAVIQAIEKQLASSISAFDAVDEMSPEERFLEVAELVGAWLDDTSTLANALELIKSSFLATVQDYASVIDELRQRSAEELGRVLDKVLDEPNSVAEADRLLADLERIVPWSNYREVSVQKILECLLCIQALNPQAGYFYIMPAARRARMTGPVIFASIQPVGAAYVGALQPSDLLQHEIEEWVRNVLRSLAILAASGAPTAPHDAPIDQPPFEQD